MINDSLYSDPRTYDLMFPDAAHVSFYVDEARRSGGPVLEVACGTGSLLVPIAETGIEVVGLDLSPEMLSAARVRAEAAGVSLELHQGDMCDLDLGRPISAFRSQPMRIQSSAR